MDYKYIIRKRGIKPEADTSISSVSVAAKVRSFHKTIPGYKPTPLVLLPGMAKELGIGRLYVKDESYRFGLNAFKALGGSYAVANILAEKMGAPLDNLAFDQLLKGKSPLIPDDMTFITATDGNHGRGLAWFVNKLGYRSVVYMPKGSAQERLDNILAENADAHITKLNYDGSVHKAERDAEAHGWTLVQDTAWEGYEKIPSWIMQGYMTLADEIHDGLLALGDEKPTHIILQAGVGSYAGAVLGYFASTYGKDRPITIIVEPTKAACHYKSAKIDDGMVHFVEGDMPTIMAGLACGEPSIISWKILDSYADAFITCPDYVAAEGMRLLANPPEDDPRIVSGESGAVGAGLIREIMRNSDLAEFKEQLHFDSSSRILIISTEGATDQAHYKAVVWDGKNPSYHED
jgi:diaminopropionate ammonia-lyase